MYLRQMLRTDFEMIGWINQFLKNLYVDNII